MAFVNSFDPATICPLDEGKVIIAWKFDFVAKSLPNSSHDARFDGITDFANDSKKQIDEDVSSVLQELESASCMHCKENAIAPIDSAT